LNLLACFFFSSTLLGYEWPVPFSQNSLNISTQKVAVVLGAGPAGLLAAQALLKSGKHQQIIIVEKRQTFSRFNFVNFFPESWPMLHELNVAEDFMKVSTPMEFLHFHSEANKQATDILLDDGSPLDSFNYKGKVLDILNMPKAGLHVVNLAELQHQLSTSLVKNNKIFLINGTAAINNNTDSNFHDIEITQNINEYDTQKYSLTPDLIIVAEGAHSASRNNLSIQFNTVLKKQFWCSGSVSLKDTRENPRQFLQVLDVIRDEKPNVRNFGIFQVRNSELFLVGTAAAHESVDQCLQRNAWELINAANQRDGLASLAIAMDKIEVIEKSQDIIEITPSKADKFYSNNNLIIFGDAAGNGTPKGGIGFSLVTGVYSQALLDLLAVWELTGRQEILETYAQRVSEIVDYWHTKIRSDEVM
jgi:2-polyprenyl-6-methoxyphenol hydroxylase-like FAD-dependent oxidoreductase